MAQDDNRTAAALPACAQDPTDPPPDILIGLRALMVDADADVGNWATCGVGTMLDADTPEIRRALLGRTELLPALLRLHARQADGEYVGWLDPAIAACSGTREAE